MHYLEKFFSLRENQVVPRLGTRKFRHFSKDKDRVSMRLFFYSFFSDYFSFLYDIDNDLLKGRYLFSDRVKKLFRIDFIKNQKISRIIRPFDTYIFKIRRNRFFLLTGASWRKKLRRTKFWEKCGRTNKKILYTFYQNNKQIYNPSFLDFNFFYSVSSVTKVRKKKEKTLLEKFIIRKKVKMKKKYFQFIFFRKFNKKRQNLKI